MRRNIWRIINFVLFLTMVLFMSSCKKEYTVTFRYDNGDVIKEVYVKKGDGVEYPTLSFEDGYYYEWSNSNLNSISKDMEVIATKKEANKIVKYYIEGIVVKEETAKYFSIVEAPSVPNYYKDYSFVETITKNGNDYIYTYNLSYSSKIVTITFKDTEGNLIKSADVLYNASYTDPFPSSTIEGYYYEWDKSSTDVTNLTSDIIVIGTLKVANKKVEYYIDDKLVKESTVDYFETIDAPEYPDNTKNQELILTKTFDQDSNTYFFKYVLKYDICGGTITYFDGNTKLSLSPSAYITGDEIVLPNYSKEGYQFIGWYASNISLYRYTEIDTANDGDVILYARFVNVTEKEPLILLDSDYHFTDITKVAHSSGNGTYVYQPVLPSNAPNSSKLQYDWSTSDSSIATVSIYASITAKSAGYCILTATYKLDPTVVINCVIRSSSDGITFATLEEANAKSLFVVKFVDKDGKVLEEQIVNKGGAAVPPTPPTYDGLAFAGWNKDFYNINEDTTITATYVSGVNNYVGKKVAIIGDSISTYQDYIPSGYSCFYPYPTADVNDVNQTWWKQAANKLGAGIFVNNSYSGSCVSAGGTSATSNDVRLATTVIGEQKPDVIIIFMGSNDCASAYVGAINFESSYKVMLDKLKILCPNAEIILCTLPKSNLYKEEDRISFNEIIINYAEEYKLKTIDFASVDLTDTLVDTAHPNKAGMTLLAEKLVLDILK